MAVDNNSDSCFRTPIIINFTSQRHPQMQPEPDIDLSNALNILAQVLEKLEIEDASIYSYSTAVINLKTENLSLERSLLRLQQVEEGLKDYLASLEHETRLMAHWNDVLVPGSPDSVHPEPTMVTERRKDATVRKAKEMHKELVALQAQEIPVTIRQFMEKKDTNEALDRKIKEKRMKIKAFQGLPPNLESARLQLRAAREKQMELFALRERLLGRMADSVA